MNDETTWVPVYIKHETDLAILCGEDENDPKPVWVPKSQIIDSTDDLNIGSDVEIEMPVWLAEEKGLI
jgi:hypothetical protein